MDISGIGELKKSLGTTNEKLEEVRRQLERTNDDKLDAVLGALKTNNSLLERLLETREPAR